MKRTLSLFVAFMGILLAAPPPASTTVAGTSIVGTVLTGEGHPIQGAEIVVKDVDGNIVGRATTNAKGQYAIADVPPGEYTLTLDPANTNLQGNTVFASIGPEGLTVNWTALPDPLAAAAPTNGTGTSASVGGILLWAAGTTAAIVSSEQNVGSPSQ